MPCAPRCARTRASSSLTSVNAWSHDTSTNESLPRPLRSRRISHDLRTAGRSIRKGEYTMAGMAPSMGDGAGLCANDSQAIKRASSTTAV